MDDIEPCEQCGYEPSEGETLEGPDLDGPEEAVVSVWTCPQCGHENTVW